MRSSWYCTSLFALLLACGSESSPQATLSPDDSNTGVNSGSSTTQTTGIDTSSSTGAPTTSVTSSTQASSQTHSTTQGASTATTTELPASSDVDVTSETLASTSAETSQTTTSTDTDSPAGGQTSAELLATFGLGWNLGNSLDVPEEETAWGNPRVDAAMFAAVVEAGFKVVRIPVTWSLFTGAAPSYTLEPSRLSRVQEVVELALNAGLYAIINLHHDGADAYDGVEWLTLNDASGAITDANNQAVEQRFRAVWTQLATHFNTFDHRLLFESMNEIHDGYDAPDPAYYPIINNLNQVFVDIVRGTDGNNTTRHLVVPGYNTNVEYTLAGFEPPQDPTEDRLILSVHFYDPWPFAGEGASPAWGAGEPGADSWGQETHVVSQFDQLKAKYIDQGLPMIIGEYGAVNVTGSERYRRYYMEYVTQAACQRGLVPVYWDNGGTGSGPDSFGLFNRNSKDVVFPEILEAMFRGCQSSAGLDSIARP